MSSVFCGIDLLGAGDLVNFLVDLAKQRKSSRLEIGLEATSVYGTHLRDLLVTSNDLAPFHADVYELNPALVSGLKKAFPKRPNTDNLDALAIAERVRFGQLARFPKNSCSLARFNR